MRCSTLFSSRRKAPSKRKHSIARSSLTSTWTWWSSIICFVLPSGPICKPSTLWETPLFISCLASQLLLPSILRSLLPRRHCKTLRGKSTWLKSTESWRSTSRFRRNERISSSMSRNSIFRASGRPKSHLKSLRKIIASARRGQISDDGLRQLWMIVRLGTYRRHRFPCLMICRKVFKLPSLCYQEIRKKCCKRFSLLGQTRMSRPTEWLRRTRNLLTQRPTANRAKL